MAIFNYISKAEASNEFFKVTAEAPFEVSNDLGIKMTKVVNKPDEVYFVGEQIIFTITLEREEGIQGAINQITLKDLIPESVIIDTDGVEIVKGTNGNVVIDIAKQLVTIEKLVLNNGNPIIEVTITGKVTDLTVETATEPTTEEAV